MSLEDNTAADTSIPVEYLVTPLFRRLDSGYIPQKVPASAPAELSPTRAICRSMAGLDPIEAARAHRRTSLEHDARICQKQADELRDVKAKRNLQVSSQAMVLFSRRDRKCPSPALPAPFRRDGATKVAGMWRVHGMPHMVQNPSGDKSATSRSSPAVSQHRARCEAAKEYNRQRAEEYRAHRARRTASFASKPPRRIRPLALSTLDRRLLSSHRSSDAAHARAQFARMVASAPEFHVVDVPERGYPPVSRPATFVSPGPDPAAPFVRL